MDLSQNDPARTTESDCKDDKRIYKIQQGKQPN